MSTDFRVQCILSFAAVLTTTGASAATIVEYDVPAAFANPDGAGPRSITSGPDGNLWFTENTGGGIGKIDLAGNVTVFPIPGPYPPGPFGPVTIAPGPDGNLWFTDPTNNRIGRITPAGSITTFPLPTANSGAHGITPGPDGNLWFTEAAAGVIGKITATGVVTEYPIADPTGNPSGITAAAGMLYFANLDGLIGSVTPQGYVALFPGDSSFEGSIATGPDQTVWFTVPGLNCGSCSPRGPGKIDSFNPATGIENTFFVSDNVSFSLPHGIASGPDGNMWFTDEYSNTVGSISPDGVIAQFPIPSPGSGPTGIVTGPDGNIWFTETATAKIGKLLVSSLPANIDGYLSGNWYDPAQSGQGFQLEFTSDGNTAVAIWFTFAPDGSGQRWIYAQGPYDTATNTVTLPAVLSSGASFPPNFSSSDLTKVPWGTLTFTFYSCTTGTASWNSTVPGYGAGSMPITRLTQIKGAVCRYQQPSGAGATAKIAR